MPEQVRCPSCDATLRVPDNLLGKNVKCPKCQKTFTAEMDEPEELEEVGREPAPSGARRRSRPAEDIEDEEELPSEEERDEEYEDRPRRRRGGRRRAAAVSAVAGPAISLIVLGGFDIFLVLLDMVLSLTGFNFVPGGAKRGAGPGAGPNFDFGSQPVWVVVPGHILGLCLAALILTGGLKMRQLQSYGLAITASILAILPCGNCCCIGLPLGIWALVVLNRPEVKDAFR